MDVNDYGMGIDSQLGLRRGQLAAVRQERDDSTHVEDMEDPVEIQLPGSDLSRVVLRMEESRDRIPPTPFDDLSLYLCSGPGIESTVGWSTRNVHQWFNSRRQLVYRIGHGLTELFQPPPVHSSRESSADFGTK